MKEAANRGGPTALAKNAVAVRNVLLHVAKGREQLLKHPDTPGMA
jgi:hypothetical protein